MAVFENESNASQDANYREHLNRNWDNGNIAFDNLFGKYSGLLDEYVAVNSRLDDAESQISDLKKDIETLTKKHNDDSEATNQRLTKLEKAVFEAQYINDTDDVADNDKSVVSQDINDTNVIDDDDGLIIEQDNYKSLPSDIN